MPSTTLLVSQGECIRQVDRVRQGRVSQGGNVRRNALPALLLLLICTGCASFTDAPSARTPGTVIDDEFIERIANREINRADPMLKAGHVGVVSFNGVVLLIGQVQNAQLVDEAETVVQRIRKVRSVHNELQVGGPTSMVARTNDAWLTTKVKTRLVANGDVDANKFKVVTEDSVVYLLGMVPRDEANTAVGVARNVFGVQKIVKVFEYLD